MNRQHYIEDGTGAGDRLLDVREAAAYLKISYRTLYGLVATRRVPYRKAGRRLLFLQSELLEWTRPTPNLRQD